MEVRLLTTPLGVGPVRGMFSPIKRAVCLQGERLSSRWLSRWKSWERLITAGPRRWGSGRGKFRMRKIILVTLAVALLLLP
jgi:hypothetical protein